MKEVSINYCNKIISGEILACKSMRAAAERFLTDLNDPAIYFDDKAANLFKRFCGTLKHTTGKYNNQPFELSEWQQFYIYQLLGAKFVDSGDRVYRESYISLGRKNGKSSLIAALSLYFLMLDGEANAEIICVANSIEQVRNNLKLTVDYSKTIDPESKYIKAQHKRILYKNNILTIRAADHKKLDGLNISCGIIDEFSADGKQSTIDVIKSSQSSRRNPFLVILTTAGINPLSDGYHTYQVYKEQITGERELNRRALILIYEYEDEDIESGEWLTNYDLLQKSTPNLDISVSKQSLIEAIQNTQIDTSTKIGTIVKVLNKWVDGKTIDGNNGERYISDDIIVNCMQQLDFEQFRGCACWIGADLASHRDLTALSYMFVKDGIHYFINKAFLPEMNTNLEDRKHQFSVWAGLNFMTLTQGNNIDQNYIANDIIETVKKYDLNLIEVGVDDWNASQFLVQLELNDIPYVPIPQSWQRLNRPIKSLEIYINREQAIIDKNPVTRWCFYNSILKTNEHTNVKIFKANPNDKIDITVAMIMALDVKESNKSFITYSD